MTHRVVLGYAQADFVRPALDGKALAVHVAWDSWALHTDFRTKQAFDTKLDSYTTAWGRVKPLIEAGCGVPDSLVLQLFDIFQHELVARAATLDAEIGHLGKAS